MSITSTKRIVRAAAVQIAPDLESGAGTLERVGDAIVAAAREGVQLAVFPETGSSRKSVMVFHDENVGEPIWARVCAS